MREGGFVRKSSPFGTVLAHCALFLAWTGRQIGEQILGVSLISGQYPDQNQQIKRPFGILP